MAKRTQPARPEIIGARQAAEELGISQRRVVALIASGRLPATQIGREWAILRGDLEAVRVRKAGRPPSVS